MERSIEDDTDDTTMIMDENKWKDIILIWTDTVICSD